MKRILATIFCLLPLVSFAEWLDAKNMQDANIEDTKFMEKLDNRFFIPFNKPCKGIEIAAFSKSLDRGCTLRYINNCMDYKIYVSNPIWQKGGKMYLLLLDTDEYLVKEFFIDTISSNWSGETFGKENIEWSDFSNVHYFRLELRA